MSWVDLVIIVLVLLSAARGWYQGLLRQVGSLVGRIVGFLLGARYAPQLSQHLTHAFWRPAAAIALVVVATIVGGWVLSRVGGLVSSALHLNKFLWADSVSGALLAAATTLVICWLVAGVVSDVSYGSLAQEVNQSVILKDVQRVMPSPPAFEGRLQVLLGNTHLPSLFTSDLAPIYKFVSSVKTSTSTTAAMPAGVVAVAASGGCGTIQHGTGFFISPSDVVTDAHVVAGARTVTVNRHRGVVVYFDPRADLAVVRTTLSEPTLSIAAAVPSSATALLVDGFPTALGPRTQSSGLFEGVVEVPSRSIYSDDPFVRSLELLDVDVSAGDAGAPVLVNNAVVGVVLEPSSASAHQAFATSLSTLRADLAAVTSTPVSTGACLN